MPTDFKLPDLGENIDSGDVISVLVNEGDEVQVNQGVIELETGKAVVEVPSSLAGKITKVHVKVGDKLPVGAVVLSVEAASAAAPAPAKQSAPEAPAAPPKPQPAPAPAPQAAAPKAPAPEPVAPPVAEEEEPHPHVPVNTPVQAAYSNENGGAGLAPAAAPATRRLARELGVDLGRVGGSGPGGRITREDIITAVRQTNAAVASASAPAKPAAKPETPAAPAAPAAKAAATAPAAPTAPDGVADTDFWGPIRRTAMTKIRKTIAVNMARSASTIPHVTNFDSADITELERIRKATAADYASSNIKLTSMAFVMKAVALALKHHSAINASIDMDGEQILYKDYVNLGVAVDTERGLVVPVIRNVDRLSIPQIAGALSDVANRARAAQFTMDDLRGGTFTISNMGAVGGQYSTPIINHPEVAILLLGRSKMQPTVVDGTKIEPRFIMPLSLSYDHRLVDGATASRFLNEVISFLEVPGRLLLAP